MARGWKKGNRYEIRGAGITSVFTSKGEEFFISTEDMPRVLAHTWSISRNKRDGNAYIKTNSPGVGRLHQFIRQVPEGKVVDHIDGDGFNNTRENLRALTSEENTHNRQHPNKNNTTGFLNVYRNKRGGFYVQICRKCYGTFRTKEEANTRAIEVRSTQLPASKEARECRKSA